MTSEDPRSPDSPTMALVVANAQRLLDDAHLLFEHGRYPTSLSIAILSVEESGKALLMCRPVKQKDLRSHVTKQTDAALQLVQVATITAMKGIGWGYGVEHDVQEAGHAVPDERVDALVAALDAVRNSDVVRRYLELQADVGDHAKMRGLYVDIDAQHQATSVPFIVDAAMAREYIDLAESALEAVYDVVKAYLERLGLAAPVRVVLKAKSPSPPTASTP